MIHGSSDNQNCSLLGFGPRVRGGGIVAAESSRLRNAGEVHSSRGWQIQKNPIRHAMQISEAPISTMYACGKLDISYCGTSKDPPQTKIAGQICIIPRLPAKAQISQ